MVYFTTTRNTKQITLILFYGFRLNSKCEEVAIHPSGKYIIEMKIKDTFFPIVSFIVTKKLQKSEDTEY